MLKTCCPKLRGIPLWGAWRIGREVNLEYCSHWRTQSLAYSRGLNKYLLNDWLTMWFTDSCAMSSCHFKLLSTPLNSVLNLSSSVAPVLGNQPWLHSDASRSFLLKLLKQIKWDNTSEKAWRGWKLDTWMGWGGGRVWGGWIKPKADGALGPCLL